MSRALLDTDILSEVLKNRDENVARAASRYLAQHGELTVSAVSIMEIAYGLYRAGRVKQLEELESAIATRCHVLAFDESAAFLAGRIEADLERRGTPVDAPDVMIAAVAIRARLPVVTANEAHFSAIRSAGYELSTQNWREPRA